MKLLTYTTLHPNGAQPVHGLFVHERLRHIVSEEGVSATVVAPVPWFPLAARAFGRYGVFARVPRTETHCGLRVLHPRYPLLPKIGMRLAPWLMAASTASTVRSLLAEPGSFDLLDAHYLYPDGVAAAALARKFGRPLVLSARGSDVNLLMRYPAPRRWILSAVQQSAATIAVSEALKERLCELGAAPERVVVIRNGVDLDHFQPLDRQSVRRELGYTGYTALCVGTLIESKGQQLAIEALTRIPDLQLVLIGEGQARERFQELARRLGVAERVRFAGMVPRERMPAHYSAADVLVLPSEREGMPNAVLEALACGLPVVGTRVGGIPELIDDASAGRLMKRRAVDELVRCVGEIRAAPIDPQVIRARARRFDWQGVARRQLELYRAVLAGSRTRS